MKIPVIGIILLCLIGFISCKGSDSSSGDSASTSSTDTDTDSDTDNTTSSTTAIFGTSLLDSSNFGD